MFYSAPLKSWRSQALPLGRSTAVSIVTRSETFCPISIEHSSWLHLPGSFCRGPPSFDAALSPWPYLCFSSTLFGRILLSKHLAYLLRLLLKVMESEVWRIGAEGASGQVYGLSVQRRHKCFINIMFMNALGEFLGELIKLAGG